MSPRRRLRPIQVAWLSEIGVDLHGLRLASEAGSVARPILADAARCGREAEAMPPGGAAPRPAADVSRRASEALRQNARTPPQADVRLPQPDPPVPGSPAGPSVADSVDVDALAQAVRACQRCVLHAQRAQAVAGAGVTRQPAWFIVGEQPGIEDDAVGQPFQGDQGRLLAAMLAAVRLPQADSLYATHVVKCRAVGGREPTPAEVAACLPYLHREIALLRPLRILALGRVAAQAVLGSTADLDTLRGGPHAYRMDPDEAPIPVWVTHQPSALLVRSADKAEAWRDLVALRRFVLEAQG